MIHGLQHTHLVHDLGGDGGDELGVLQPDLLDCHEVAGVQVHGCVHVPKRAAADEMTLLPPHVEIGRRRREVRQRPIDLVGYLQHAAQV